MELTKQLTDLKNELASLRVQKVSSGSANKVSQIHHVRKAIARVLTVMRQNDRNAVKQTLTKKKHLPKDMRVKKTRALRRELTKYEASRETVRQHKKSLLNKVRKYAIKA